MIGIALEVSRQATCMTPDDYRQSGLFDVFMKKPKALGFRSRAMILTIMSPWNWNCSMGWL